MADNVSNQQNFQITGSAGVSIGSVEQRNVTSLGSKDSKVTPEPPRKLRILFVGANPSDTSRLRLDQESKAIGAALRAGNARDLFELEHAWAASSADLQDHLLRYKPQIVHFSGHGEDGALMLEQVAFGGSRDKNHAASPHEIARLFALARNDIRCVVLNACSSAPLAAAVAESIDCAIGMAEPVDDQLAILFSWSFYHSLSNGLSVKKAFDLACTQSGLHGGPDGQAPRLFARRVDPADVYLLGEAAGQPAAP
jgi:hypothetical protein